MNKKILFIAKTPYQLLVLVKILLTMHKNDVVSLVLCDTIANVDVLYQQLRVMHLFKEVKVYRIIEHIGSCKSFSKLLKCSSYNFKKEAIWDEFSGFTARFDEIYVSGIDAKCAYLLDKKAQHLNANIKMHLFEDGFSIYANINQSRYRRLTFKDSKNIFRKKIFLYLMHNDYVNWHSVNVFSPELLDWTPTCKVKKIESISSDDKRYLNIADSIFNASDVIDEYKKDIIFFEEGYYADGISVGDLDVVTMLANIVKKENIMVKVHPRNPVNRFANLGFTTNKNTAVPWEVIAQNIDLNNKTLITIASQAVLMPLLIMDTKPKSIIMLMNCKEYEDVQLTLGLPIVKKLAEKYSQDVFLPCSLAELKDYL